MSICELISVSLNVKINLTSSSSSSSSSWTYIGLLIASISHGGGGLPVPIGWFNCSSHLFYKKSYTKICSHMGAWLTMIARLYTCNGLVCHLYTSSVD